MFKRYYRRKPRRKAINEYNFENNSVSFTIPTGAQGVQTSWMVLVAPNNTAGVRKIVNLSRSFTLILM